MRRLVRRPLVVMLCAAAVASVRAIAPVPGAFDVPGSTSTYAGDVNAKGQIVGTYTDADGNYHGFLLDNGVFTTIDPPAAPPSTEASGINNLGQIVGDYIDGAGQHGFLFDKGVYTTLDVPGASFTLAEKINNRGQIVGFYGVAPWTHHG